jgi:pumilio RNA-binding family
MCSDKFANYVVQRLIDVLDPKERGRIGNALRPYSAELKKSVYAKHILSKIL